MVYLGISRRWRPVWNIHVLMIQCSVVTYGVPKCFVRCRKESWLALGRSTNRVASLSLRNGKKLGIFSPISDVCCRKKEVEQEVELILHDSETVKKVTHTVKLLQFHTDYRPPYYGTWRKKVAGLSPRNPWKKAQVQIGCRSHGWGLGWCFRVRALSFTIQFLSIRHCKATSYVQRMS